MPTLTRALIAIVTVVLVHVLAIFTGWYELNKWFDIPMHFAGGCVIAYLGLAIWNLSIQKITFQKNLKPVWQTVVYAVGIVGFVALVGVAWEWYEFIFDAAIRRYRYDFQPTQMGLGDTMLDLFLDLLGAVVIFILFRNRPQS